MENGFHHEHHGVIEIHILLENTYEKKAICNIHKKTHVQRMISTWYEPHHMHHSFCRVSVSFLVVHRQRKLFFSVAPLDYSLFQVLNLLNSS